jgi:hypothetical protein
MTTACGPDDSGAAATPAQTAPAQTTPAQPADNGVAAKSAGEILRAATTAFTGAKSVHLKGSMTDAGETVGLDLYLGHDGARGAMRAPMGSKSILVSIISAKGAFYLKSRQLWAAAGGSALGDLVGDRWVLIPRTNSDFKEFEDMINLKKFGKQVFTPEGKITKGRTAVINGTPAIGLDDGDSLLYIATTGTPYPLKIVPKKPVKPGEQLAFLDYDAPVNATPPAHPLDLSKLGR